MASSPLSIVPDYLVSSRSWSVPSTQSHPSSHIYDVEPRPSCKRHERYYFADGNVTFLVEGILYNVHRFFFQNYSMHFSSLLSLPFGGRGQGLSDHEAIPLAGITVREFDIFLTMFYPAKIGVYDAATVDDWSAILALASHWTFPSIKDLSIQKLLSIASPIDKIVLGRKYRIDDWLAGAYVEVCSREAALTEEEGDRLGMKDVIKITRLRQGSKGTSFSPIEGVDELMDAFGLPVVADTHTAVDSEKDAISIERSTGIHPEENAAFAAETECTHEQKNDNPSENESTGIADDQVAPALACSDCGHPAFFCICGLHLAVSALADRTVPPKKKKLKEKKGKKGSRLHSQFDFPQLPRQ